MHGSLRDITIFIAAYEERSFTAAAQRENATQSGISQHIRNLEHGLGIKLFLRQRGGVTPTPAAHGFYRNCLEVLRAHEKAKRDVARFASSESGEVRVGLMPTMTSRTVAPALKQFISANPNISVHIVEGYSGTLTQMVKAGELDFAVVPDAPGSPGVRSRPFVQTLETLVSCADSGLPHLAPVRLPQLGPLKLVLPGNTNARRQTIESYCATNGVLIEEMVELDAMMATLDFIAQSDWMAILPGIMMPREHKGRRLTVNPITGPGLVLDLILIEPTRKPLTAAAERFIDVLEAESVRLNEGWWPLMPTTMANDPVATPAEPEAGDTLQYSQV
jgi:LysR family transcriptional regulator, nitrogen assimilation regulatory protein